MNTLFTLSLLFIAKNYIQCAMRYKRAVEPAEQQEQQGRAARAAGESQQKKRDEGLAGNRTRASRTLSENFTT